jgi:hypothetical protein
MRLPQEVIDRLLGDKDFLGSLTSLIKAATSLVNWTLIVLATTSIYKGITELISWFR